MPSSPDSVGDVTIWTDAAASPLVTRVLDRLGQSVRPVAVGGPRCREVDQLARHLECDSEDDLRKLVVEHPAPFVLFAAASGQSGREMVGALDRSTSVLAVEPVVATFDDLKTVEKQIRRAGKVTDSAWNQIISPGSFLRGPGWSAAAEPTEILTTPRLIQFTSTGPRSDRSLFARLYEAWEIVLQFGAIPQQIDASLNGRSVRMPHDLRQLQGHLAAHARVDDQTTALVLVSDHAGMPARHLEVIGDEAHLRVGDLDYQLADTQGESLDGTPAADRDAVFAGFVADDWVRLIERKPAVTNLKPSVEHVLACCHASALAAHTGQGESPAKMLEMVS